MTDLVRQQVTQLSSTFLQLQRRVRQAVAGEIGEAVASAFAELVTASLAGQPTVPASRHYPTYAPSYGRADWDEPDTSTPEPTTTFTRNPTPFTEALMAGLMTSGRHLLTRRSLSWGTVGLGLGAGLALFYGGPLARTLLGLWWTIERLRTTTAALGESANFLERV